MLIYFFESYIKLEIYFISNLTKHCYLKVKFNHFATIFLNDFLGFFKKMKYYCSNINPKEYLYNIRTFGISFLTEIYGL